MEFFLNHKWTQNYSDVNNHLLDYFELKNKLSKLILNSEMHLSNTTLKSNKQKIQNIIYVESWIITVFENPQNNIPIYKCVNVQNCSSLLIPNINNLNLINIPDFIRWVDVTNYFNTFQDTDRSENDNFIEVLSQMSRNDILKFKLGTSHNSNLTLLPNFFSEQK